MKFRDLVRFIQNVIATIGQRKASVMFAITKYVQATTGSRCIINRGLSVLSILDLFVLDSKAVVTALSKLPMMTGVVRWWNEKEQFGE